MVSSTVLPSGSLRAMPLSVCSRRRWLSRIFCFVAIRNRPPSTVSLQPKKLRDEMRLSGCLYNRSSAVDVRVLVSRGRQANPVLTYETALRRFPSASLAKPLPEQKKLPDSLIAAAQCTNYSLVLSWHFKLKDKQIETL